MRITRPVALACLTLLVGACAKKDKAATDSSAAAAAAAAAAPAPPPAPTLSLADFAGKWQLNSIPTAGKDTTPTKSVLTATADTSGWVLDFPSGLKVPMQITVSGDSLLFKTQPYASQRRKNLKVSTDGSFKLQGGKLTGMTTAHYQTAKADSVLQLRIEGTKMP